MKKVINGSRYDTDTAKCLAHWEISQDYSALGWYDESLYRTKAGKWFLHGGGNAASPYASRKADGWSGSGESIIPLSEDAARQWAEQHLTGAEYETIFGMVDSKENVQATVYIPASLADKLAAGMDAERCSRNELILKALQEYLK